MPSVRAMTAMVVAKCTQYPLLALRNGTMTLRPEPSNPAVAGVLVE